MTTNLSEDLLTTTLEALPGWESNGTTIWRDVHLTPEADAELRRQVAVDGGSMGHDPEITDRGNGVTRYTLSTGEAVTELDITFASHLSDLVHRLTPLEPGVEAVRADAPEMVSRARGAGRSSPATIGVGTASGSNAPIMPLAGKTPHLPEAGVSTEQSTP